MTQQEANENPDVVTGTLLVCDKLANVLFDPDATNSFMSCIFAEGVNKELKCLPEELLISTPLGETYVSKWCT